MRKEYQKNYYEKHKNKIISYGKSYYENNKSHIMRMQKIRRQKEKEKRKFKIECKSFDLVLGKGNFIFLNRGKNEN